MNGRLLLVDGHAYAYRSFYAIREMRSPSGEATNAVFGFVKALAKLRGWLGPTHVGVIWDGGLDATRMAALPGYKAQRPEMPADLGKQIDGLMEYLPSGGIASVCREGVEADDLIASIARKGARRGMEVVIASADKDFMQLVEDRIGLVNPNDKVERIWGAAEVVAKTGVQPRQVVDYLSLVGDAVDNIPGVPGVGVKTAAGLLTKFGSVEDLYRRLGEVESARVRGALDAAKADVMRNRELVRLRDDMPGEVETLKLGVEDLERLREYYRRWGFRGLLAETEKALGSGVGQTNLL